MVDPQVSFSSLPTQDSDPQGSDNILKDNTFVKSDSFFQRGGLNIDGTATRKYLCSDKI